ncbi:MAG: pitrilysin family protein, partial [Candidatus Zixiibacteriota bacterium]
TGFAHLFEHMMFQGSEHHDVLFAKSIVKYGGVNNGSTTEDRTNYWENLPSNYLEKALWLEADRMGYLLPSMTQERLDNQRSVVMNEKRQNYDDQPYGKVRDYMRGLLYPPEHPYSWIPIGRMEDLAAASLEDVQNFFKMYYTPNNASLCIAGDFDPAQAKEWVEKYFGPIPPGPAVERIEDWVPALNEEIRATVEDKVQLPRLYMAWHTPPYFAPGDAEFDLLAGVMSSGKSSRLYKSLVYDKQIAQDVAVYQASCEIGSTFNITVTAKEGHSLEEIEKEVNRILDDIAVNGVTPEEFERSRINWESGFVRNLQTIGNFGGRADRLNTYNVYLGDPGKVRWDRDRYADATVEGLMSYYHKYIRPDARVVLYVLPYGQLAGAQTGVDMNIEPVSQADPSFTPPNIQQTELSNGMKLYLVENHKLPLVQVKLLINSGWAADPADRPGASSLTADLLNEGTKSRNAIQISDEIQDLGINLGTGSGWDNSSVDLNTLTKNLDPAIDLMADVILNPTFPEDELQRLKQHYLGQIQQESIQPFTVAYKSFLRELYGEDHPYGQPYTGTGTKESIEAISRDDIINYYRANYLPNNSAAIVVGDITLDDARARLEKAFKKWKPGEVVTHEVKRATPVDKTKIFIVDKPGAAQSTIIVGNLIGSRNDPDYLPTSVVSHMLGGSSTARLYLNLRQDKGYTYGSYSFATGRRGQGAFVSYAQVQTDVTDKAVLEFIKEIRGMTGEMPITETELTESKNYLTMSFPQDFQTLGGVADQLARIITYDLPMDEWDTYIGQINAVDIKKAVEAANKCLHPDQLVIMVYGDKEKIEAKIRDLNLGEIIFSNVE